MQEADVHKEGKWNGAKCIFQYHNHDFCGLLRSDPHSLVCRQESKVKPTNFVISRNVRKIAKWKRDLMGEGMEVVVDEASTNKLRGRQLQCSSTADLHYVHELLLIICGVSDLISIVVILLPFHDETLCNEGNSVWYMQKVK